MALDLTAGVFAIGAQLSIDFERQTLRQAIAEQLAWSKCRDYANAQDEREADAMFNRWNEKRLAAGLVAFDDDYQPPEPKTIEIDEVEEDECA